MCKESLCILFSLPYIPIQLFVPELLIGLVYLSNFSTDVQGKMFLAAKDSQPNAHVPKVSL